MPLLQYNSGEDTVRPHISPSRNTNVLTDDYKDSWRQLEELNNVSKTEYDSYNCSTISDDRIGVDSSSNERV